MINPFICNSLQVGEAKGIGLKVYQKRLFPVTVTLKPQDSPIFKYGLRNVVAEMAS